MADTTQHGSLYLLASSLLTGATRHTFSTVYLLESSHFTNQGGGDGRRNRKQVMRMQQDWTGSDRILWWTLESVV
jgi:hypothetical protein